MTSLASFLGEKSLTVRERMDRLPRWVGWRNELRGGDPTKMPKNPNGGYNASSTDPSTWATLSEAQRAVSTYKLDGIGFVLGDGWSGADIDGPPEWKKSPPKDDAERQARRTQIWEREIGEHPVGAWIHLIGGYAEFSPNNGVKIIVPGLLLEGLDPHKNRKAEGDEGGLEVYWDERYFTVTGQKIIDRADVDLDAFRALAACRPPRNSQASAPSPSRSSANGTTPYGAAALRGEIADLRSTPEGARNDQLNYAAFKLGQYVGGEELDEAEARQQLYAAAMAAGLEPDEIRGTLDHALEDGKAQPRSAPPRTTTTRARGASVQVKAEPTKIVWGEPVPFAAVVHPGIDFPVGLLPSRMSDLVEAVADFIEVDPAVAAQPALGVHSSCFAHKVRIEQDDWKEEVNLWTLATAASGEGKSGALREVIRPVRDVQRERREEDAARMSMEEAEIAVLEARYRDQAKVASKAEGEQREVEETATRELARQLADLESGRTTRTSFVKDDVTPEALGAALSENNPLLLASAEGGLLDNFTGRYSAGVPNLDLLNGSYTGDPYSPGRTTRNASDIERPVLSMAVLPQPIVLQLLTNNDFLIRRGTLSRFLFWIAHERAGTRFSRNKVLPPAPVAAWDTHIRAMLSMPASETPWALRLSAGAREVLGAHRDQVERSLGVAEGELLRTWLNRARGHAVRLAANLHVASLGISEALATEVDDQVALNAVELMAAYEAHARAVFMLMDESEAVRDAREALRRLLESGKAEMTVRELHRRWRARSREQVGSALAELDARDWCRVEKPEPGPRGGRPSEIIRMNPRALS